MNIKLKFTESDYLYLNLLRKVLTNSVFTDEPNVNVSAKGLDFMTKFSEHYFQSNAISLLPKERFENIDALVLDIIEKNIPGDLIETGVWRGGAVIYMRALLKILNIKDRSIWVADSFEGLPAVDANISQVEAKASLIVKRFYKNFEASFEEVSNNFNCFNLLDNQVKWLKGWFKDTLPNAPIERLSLIRLDGDYYESTMDGLINLYPKLSIGGYVIIDDYGEDGWTDCKKAVNEFRSSNNIRSQLISVDSVCVYRKKEDF